MKKKNQNLEEQLYSSNRQIEVMKEEIITKNEMLKQYCD